MANQEVLSQIATRFCECENAGLRQVKTNDDSVRAVHLRGISQDTCMPRPTQLVGEQLMLTSKEYTILVSPNGSYKGVVFVVDGEPYKFGSGYNSVAHRKVLDDMGFTHVSPLVLRQRKKVEDRKKPLKMDGAIAFSPQENTPKLPEYSYRKVTRPTGVVDGVVFCDGSCRHYFLPGSQVDGAIRILSDHGYDPYEEKKGKIFDGMQAEVYPLLFLYKKTLRLSKVFFFTFWRWPDLHWRLKDIIRNVYHYSLSFGGQTRTEFDIIKAISDFFVPLSGTRPTKFHLCP